MKLRIFTQFGMIKLSGEAYFLLEWKNQKSATSKRDIEKSEKREFGKKCPFPRVISKIRIGA